MSLLDIGKQNVTIYLEEVWTDSDGNTMTRPGSVGIPAKVTIQFEPASGTSQRRVEQDNEGFETEQNYRMRVPRNFPYVIGAQSKIVWDGKTFSVNGDAQPYNGSPRTAHLDYSLRRT